MRLRQAISFFLIFLLSTFALAVDVALDGTHYPLRWGEREPVEDDLVKPYPPPIWANGYAACFKKGSQITLRLIRRQGDPEVQGWKVLYAELRSKVTGEVYWKRGESRMLGPDETYTLGSVPEFIEWAELRGSVIMVVGTPSEPEPGGSETSLLVQTIDRVTEIFVVFDEPKALMSPAWVSVLRISCRWARGETTPDGAARKLTEMTHHNTVYDPEASFFCYPPLPDQGEYFYLKLFLEQGMRGQCNEIADFLCCLMTSVGIRASVQRTNRRPFPKEKAFWTNKLLVREGELPTYRFHHWHYHQYVLFNYSPQSVYDGTIRFHPTVVHLYYPHQAPDYGYVVGWVRGGIPPDGDWARAETTYRRFLVSPYIPLSDPPQTYTILWEPTPEPSGFIPSVYASDQITCQR